MNIKRAKEEIKNTIKAYLLKDDMGQYAIPSIRQRPVLLMGPPGIGKTQIMEQIARECRVGLVAYTITHHTRQSAVGLPFIEKKTYGGREYAVTEYTMSEIVASIYDKMEETGLREGILFIDEINCVSETLAPAMLQFLQCKTFGSHRIPEGWIIAAAGNPPEYNKSVREFDVVTLDRIKKIDVEPDFEVWKEYACRENIHPAVLSYLGIKAQNFCHIETTVDGKLFATPRGWEDLSQLIHVYEAIGIKVDREVVGQYIQHPKIAKDFANYLELYYKYQDDYQVDEILAGTIRESLCSRVAKAPFDERLSVTGLLLSKLTDNLKQLQEQNRVMKMLMEQLKAVRQDIYKENGDPGAVLDALARGMETRMAKDKKSGLLGRREERIGSRAAAALLKYAGGMKGASWNEPDEAWEWIRRQFMAESDAYESMKESCGRKLEHAFDFMEASFGVGQEMVIFITELNAGEACVEFLNGYYCERYFHYNKELLFDQREMDIRNRLMPM